MELLLAVSRYAEKIWTMHHFAGVDVRNNGKPDAAEILVIMESAERIAELCREWLAAESVQTK